MINILVGFIGLWLVFSVRAYRSSCTLSKLEALLVGLDKVGLGALLVVSVSLILYGLVGLLR